MFEHLLNAGNPRTAVLAHLSVKEICTCGLGGGLQVVCGHEVNREYLVNRDPKQDRPARNVQVSFPSFSLSVILSGLVFPVINRENFYSQVPGFYASRNRFTRSGFCCLCTLMALGIIAMSETLHRASIGQWTL
jgi:hypothetical protein